MTRNVWRSPARALIACISMASMFAAMLATPAPSHAATSGRWFWYLRDGNYVHVHCVRLAASRHLLLYAPQTARVLSRDVRDLIDLFESRIYPTDTTLFGVPQRLTPVSVLLVPLDPMTLGYFDPNDAAPPLLVSDPLHSNHANVLYLRLPSIMPDRPKMSDIGEVLAHELQHLIEYRLRVVDRHSPAQDDWLNEGLSFYAQLANGFWTPRDSLKVQAAMQQPSWPVTSLYHSAGFLRRYARLAYGRAGMFTTYLAAQFGPSFIHDVLNSNLVGMSAVDAELRARGHRLDAATVFSYWAVAQLLDSGGKYGYGTWSRLLHSTPALAAPETSNYPWDSRQVVPTCLCLRTWGQAYLSLATARNGELRVSFSGPTEHLRVAVVLQDSTGEVPTQVQWLKTRHGHLVDFSLDGFGGLYNRLTFAISDVGPDASSRPGAQIRVQARLLNVSD